MKVVVRPQESAAQRSGTGRLGDRGCGGALLNIKRTSKRRGSCENGKRAGRTAAAFALSSPTERGAGDISCAASSLLASALRPEPECAGPSEAPLPRICASLRGYPLDSPLSRDVSPPKAPASHPRSHASTSRVCLRCPHPTYRQADKTHRSAPHRSWLTGVVRGAGGLFLSRRIASSLVRRSP